MIEAHPLLGLGPEGPRYHFDEYVPEDVPHPRPEGWYGHLHNIYLQYAAERGIPTMLMLMWMLRPDPVGFLARPAGPAARPPRPALSAARRYRGGPRHHDRGMWPNTTWATAKCSPCFWWSWLAATRRSRGWSRRNPRIRHQRRRGKAFESLPGDILENHGTAASATPAPG